MDLDVDCTRALEGGRPLTMIVLDGRPLIAVEGGGLRWVDPRSGPVDLALSLPVASALDGASLAGVHPARSRAVRVIGADLAVVRDVHVSFAPSAIAVSAARGGVIVASVRGEIEVEGGARWSLGSSKIDRIAIAPDGARLAGCDADGVIAATLGGHEVMRLEVGGRPSAMAWSTSHGLWTFVDGVGLVRFDVHTGASSRLELEGQSANTRAHAFSPDGTRILVSDGDEAWVADTGRGRRLCAVRTSEAGARLVCAALDADQTVGWALFDRGGHRHLARFDQS